MTVEQPGGGMEQEKGTGLNVWQKLGGWQKLWIALALISIVPAVAVVWSKWEPGGGWMRDRLEEPPTRVIVEGVGEVEFPATMSREAIELVTKEGGGNAEAIRAGIASWNKEFNKLIKSQTAGGNRSLLIRGVAFWAGGVALLYGIGWLVAWFRRRSTT